MSLSLSIYIYILYIHIIYIYIYMCIYIYIQYHGYVLLSACVGSSTLAARIDLLLTPVCVLWPQNRGQILDPKMGSTILKLVYSPASKFVAPILGPWYMRFAFCTECAELRQVASSIHVVLRLVPGCWFHSIYIYIPG